MYLALLLPTGNVMMNKTHEVPILMETMFKEQKTENEKLRNRKLTPPSPLKQTNKQKTE